MRLETVTLAGHSAEWLFPQQPPRHVVVYLHGYDGVTLRDRPRFHAALERTRTACLMPLGPECWWTAMVDPAFDPEISPIEFIHTSIVAAIEARFPELTTNLGIFGVEMGGQGALQVAYRWPRRFPNVAAISPKVDFETWHGHGTSLDRLFADRESARQQIATLQLNPLNWPRRQLLLCDAADQYCLDGVVTLASKLSSSGVPFEHDFTTSHGGFGWPYADAMADRVLDFLTA